MDLIDRDVYRHELDKAMDRNIRIGRPNPILLMSLRYTIAKLDSAPAVDAIPVEWIEKRIPEIQDDYVAGAFVGLIEKWKEEQEEDKE